MRVFWHHKHDLVKVPRMGTLEWLITLCTHRGGGGGGRLGAPGPEA